MTGPWVLACQTGNCVQVRRVGDTIEVRDSKLGEQSPVIEYSLDHWQSEVISEISDGGWLPECSYREDDAAETVVLQRLVNAEVHLRFTAAEWDPFVDGVIAGRFGVVSLTAEWQTAESDSAVLTSEATTEPRSSVSVDSGRASGPVVSDDHPAVQTTPTGDLILEVLAARHRLGEPWWHFESRNVRALTELGDLGLISVQGGQSPKTLRARLTDAGRARMLMNGYTAPIHQCRHYGIAGELRRLADEIDPPVATQPTTEGDQK